MTIYMTKVWGFSDPEGPLQFSTQGWRDRARAELNSGDVVVLVGTKGDETDPRDRGRLLGMMEPTKEIVHSLDFNLPTREVDFNSAGEYKWPYGLLNSCAWIFLEPRSLLEEISTRQFSMDAASGIVPLSADEAAKVMALPRREIGLLMPIRARARVEGIDVARRRTAPPPTTTRRGVMHLRRASAFTYCMAIENASPISFKIGWAFDYEAREREFNQTAMPLIRGLRYKTRLHRLWDTAIEAFAMEQAILRRFDDARHRANREVLCGVHYDTIEAAWIAYIQNARKKNPRRDLS
jgi:hypothetical protein